MSDSPFLLEMKSISKRFGATQALRDVGLRVERGRVMALIGENGAGKSTLMKVLSGAVPPDSGRMQLAGRRYAPAGPSSARATGVAMIYQELNLAPDLSVEDNIMLGQEIHARGWLNRARQRARVNQALERLGHPELRPNAIVRSLSVGARQLVEIARALVLQAQLIVFDEPTSSLTRQDVDHLFRVIRGLRESNLGVIYISHFLEEIRDVCDQYTVLRDGQAVGTGELAETTESQIVALMVGKSVSELFPTVPHTPGEPLLSVQNLTGSPFPADLSLSVRRGEIFGLAGLVGAGRTELIRAVYGLDAARSGTVAVAGANLRQPPRARIAAGLGMVSEDRKNEGLAQGRSLADNVTLSNLTPYARGGWLDLAKRDGAVQKWLARLNVKAASPEQEAQDLSGGNQQKIAIARVLHQNAEVLLMDEPTRGIDVGTKAQVYRIIGQLAADGKAIIFVSSYLPELLAVCDRIGVMSQGRLKAVRPVGDWTEHQILEVAMAK